MLHVPLFNVITEDAYTLKQEDNTIQRYAYSSRPFLAAIENILKTPLDEGSISFELHSLELLTIPSSISLWSITVVNDLLSLSNKPRLWTVAAAIVIRMYTYLVKLFAQDKVSLSLIHDSTALRQIRDILYRVLSHPNAQTKSVDEPTNLIAALRTILRKLGRGSESEEAAMAILSEELKEVLGQPDLVLTQTIKLHQKQPNTNLNFSHQAFWNRWLETNNLQLLGFKWCVDWMEV
jgi:hypothetical protein